MAFCVAGKAQTIGIPAVRASGLLWAVAAQSDGKAVVGGLSMNSLAGGQRENLGRLNKDGGLDFGFHPQGAFDVTALALQVDGKILVGGYLTNLAGQVSTNLARLNQDGSADSSFASPNPNEVVWAFCIQPDGKVLLGGAFTKMGATTRPYFARIYPDGSLDASFTPVLDGPPSSVAVQADGRILVAGDFQTLNGTPRNGIGRLNSDGSLDSSFVSSIDEEPYSIALQGDGKILIALDQGASGSTNTGVLRLNSDGSLDTKFVSTVPANVDCFAPQADGRILTLVESTLLRLNADGSLDHAFAAATNAGARSLALRSDGVILVAGPSIVGFTNTALSSSVLTFQGNAATWALGGASPDVAWVTFDYSTNGMDWANLGAGTRTSNGWQLSSLVLPNGFTLRARGAVTGGFFNGSFWFEQAFLGNPVVLRQPVSATNYAGSLVQLDVQAGGSEPLYYQWFKGGTPVAGATNSSLLFPNISLTDLGTYTVTVSNKFGSVTSSAATEVVLPLPKIITNDGKFGFTNGQFSFNVQGFPGQAIVIQRAGNFGYWLPVQTNVFSSEPLYFVAPSNYPRQFYRVEVQQQ